MRKLLWVAAASLMLSGCHLILPPAGTTPTPPPDDSTTIIGVPEVQPPEEEPVLTPPPVEVIKPVNWPVTLELLVEKMVQSADLPDKSSPILIDKIKNTTTMEIDTNALNQSLNGLIGSTNRLSLIPQAEIDSARQVLGLLADDSLRVRSKTIGLARYLNAPYILYTTIDGSLKAPEMTMQIMQVQTGELIWSSVGEIVRE